MTLVLHHCHQARSMRTLWLLHELGLEFRLCVHDLGPALREPDYLAVHPLGRVPALVDGPRVLFESGAIAEYLCERHSPDNLGRRPGHPERAMWLQWLHFAETMGQHVAALTQQYLVIWDDADRSPVVTKLERRRLEKTIEVIDTALDDREYLLTGGFSAVDISVGYSLYIAEYFTDLGVYPQVSAYTKRLFERPAFQAALPPQDGTLIYRKRFYAS